MGKTSSDLPETTPDLLGAVWVTRIPWVELAVVGQGKSSKADLQGPSRDLLSGNPLLLFLAPALRAPSLPSLIPPRPRPTNSSSCFTNTVLKAPSSWDLYLPSGCEEQVFLKPRHQKALISTLQGKTVTKKINNLI